MSGWEQVAERAKAKATAPERQRIIAEQAALVEREAKAAAQVIDPREDAKTEARKVQAEMFPGGKPPVEQCYLPFAPLPSDMARCSPFFPMDKKALASRPYLEEYAITRGPWGEITFTGKKLSTVEESALLAILAAIDGQREKQVEEVEGQTANVYNGPILPLLKLMGVTSGKQNYERILQSIDLLQGCRIKLQTKTAVYGVGSPVAYYSYVKGSREIKIVLSPYFLEMFTAGHVALLNVLRRASLPGEISKALFRFIESHRSKEWTGHFLTLAGALNLDLDQPPFRLRDQLKRATSALVKAGILGRRSGLKGDVVRLLPPGGEKPKKKALPATKKSPKSKAP